MYHNLPKIHDVSIFGNIYDQFLCLYKMGINIILYGNSFKKLLVYNVLQNENTSNTVNKLECIKVTYNGKVYEDKITFFENNNFIILNCRSLRTNSKIILLYLLKKYSLNYHITADLMIYKKTIVLLNIESLSFSSQEVLKSIERYNVQLIATVSSLNYIAPQIKSRFQDIRMPKINSQHLSYIHSSTLYDKNMSEQIGNVFKFFEGSIDIVYMQNIFYNMLANSISTTEIITRLKTLLTKFYVDKTHTICKICAHYEHINCFSNKDILILECLLYKLKEIVINT